MVDGIDAELQVGADFKKSLSESDKLTQQFVDLIKKTSAFEKKVLDVNKGLTQLGTNNKSLREISKLLNQLKVAQQGSVGSVARQTGTRAATTAIRNTPEASQATIDATRLAERRKIVNLGKEDFQTAQRQKAVEQQIFLTSRERFRLENKLIALGKLTNSRDAKSLAAKKQIRTEIEGTVSAQRRLVQQQKEAARIQAQATKQKKDPLERFNVNGGADIFRIQARLLLNYKLIAAAYSSTTFITDFITQLDKAFFNLQAITATTETEMLSLKGALIEASEATKFTAVEVAEAAVVLGQSGFSSQEIEDSIKSVTLLATATGTTLKDAVGVATSALNVFELQASQMSNVANLMTAAVNESKLTIQQLTLGVQYAANIAADSNIPLSELVASFGVLADAGIRSGSTLGTGTRQLLTDLKDPSEKLIAKLADLGLSFADIDVRTKGLNGVLRTLKDSGFTTADALRTMEVRAAATFSALSKGSDDIELMRQRFLQSDAAVKANATQMQSLSNTFANFQSIVGAAANTLLEKWLRRIQGVIEATNNWLSSNKDLVKRLGVVVDIMVSVMAVGFGVWLVNLVAKITMVSVSLGTMTAAMGTFRAVTAAAAGTASLLPGTLGLIIKALGLLAIVGVTAADSLGLFNDTTEDADEKLDKLKAQTNKTQGQMEKYQREIEQTTKFLNDMSRKTKELVPESQALRTTILEAQQSFRGMAGEVINAAESFETLREKIQGIRSISFSQLRQQTSKFLIDQNNELVQLEKKRQGRDVNASLGQSLETRGLGTTNIAKVFVDRLQEQGALKGLLTPFNPFNQQGSVSQLSNIEGSEDIKTLLADFIDTFDRKVENQTVANLDAFDSRITTTVQGRGGVSGNNKEIVSLLQDQLNQLRGDALTQAAGEAEKVFRENEVKDQVAFSKVSKDFDTTINKYNDELIDVEKQIAAANSLEEKQRLNEERDKIPDKLTEALEALGAPLRFRDADIRDLTSRVTDQSGRLDSALSNLNADRISDQLATINLRKRALQGEVRGTDSRADSGAISKFNALLSEQQRLQRLQAENEFDSASKEDLVAAGLNVDDARRAKLAIVDEQLLQERQNELQSFRNINNDRRDTLREVDQKLYQDLETTLDKLVSIFDETIRKIENSSAPLELQIAKAGGRLDSFDEPQNQGKITQGDRFAQEEKVRKLDLELELQEINEIEQKIAAFVQIIDAANAIRAEKGAELQALITQAEQATTNEDRQSLQQQASQAQQEEQAALQKAQELVVSQQELNIELAKRKVILEELQSSSESQINGGLFEKAFEFFQRTEGAVGSTAVIMEDTFLAGLEGMGNGFDTFLQNVLTGTATIGDAFKSFGEGLIQEMLSVVTRAAAMGFIKLIGSAILGSTGPIGPTQTAGPTGFFGLADGGYISGGLPNRDSVPAMLMPGEYVLNKKAVETIGKDTLHLLNSGVKNTQKQASQFQAPQAAAASSGPKMVNVYVVDKDNQPPVGPDDVIAVVGDNINRGGTLKKLIKTVVMT